MEKCRVLLVENQLNLALLYKQELEDDGYSVDIAHNGQKAIKLISEKKYNLVILEILLPDMSGLETLGKIIAINKDLPVIINTGFSYYKDNFMSWAADAHVLKSSDLSELKDTIKKLVSKNRNNFQKKRCICTVEINKKEIFLKK
jgi:DNA-binding response OmpR family regulator